MAGQSVLTEAFVGCSLALAALAGLSLGWQHCERGSSWRAMQKRATSYLTTLDAFFFFFFSPASWEQWESFAKLNGNETVTR